MGIFRGGKLGNAHSTAIQAAEEVIRKAEKLAEVTKIRLGPITPSAGRGHRSLGFQPLNGGWKVRVRGQGGAQDIFVYTTDPQRTQSELATLGQ